MLVMVQGYMPVLVQATPSPPPPEDRPLLLGRILSATALYSVPITPSPRLFRRYYLPFPAQACPFSSSRHPLSLCSLGTRRALLLLLLLYPFSILPVVGCRLSVIYLLPIFRRLIPHFLGSLFTVWWLYRSDPPWFRLPSQYSPFVPTPVST
jgi:hypothetical protein